MEKILWYWLRIRCMSFPEIIFRIERMSRHMLMRMGFYSVYKIPKPNFRKQLLPLRYEFDNINIEKYVNAADTIMESEIPIFKVRKSLHQVKENWNKELKAEISAPLDFGPSLNYKNPSLVGDIKYLWEPNRHLFLVSLAQAYKLTKNEKYLNAIFQLVGSWMIQCPYPKGPNWISAMEAGIRLVNWSLVWQLIGGYECPAFKDGKGRAFLNAWLEVIYRHMNFLYFNFSRFSSANNHLIGEASGLFIACLTWPFWDEVTDWEEKSYKILNEEIKQQTSIDGVNLEQAISYQQFVLDFFILAGILGERNGKVFPKEYWQYIEAMIDFLNSIMDVNGNVPMIGDADDGFVVNLSPDKDFCPYKSLVCTGAVLFDRGEFKERARSLDEKTMWLLGKNAIDKFRAVEPESKVRISQKSFPEGGYYIIGNGFGTKDEIKCIIDCGPLGYTSIAAHGHADALSFYLSVGGNEILIDPGTYAYHTKKKWRNYFRGTSAHNTIRVDKLDQSQSGGNFMWYTKAHSTCRWFEIGKNSDHFIGFHDGYKRLEDPVTHERDIFFDKRKAEFLIMDCINCTGYHTIERFFHFSEKCSVEKDMNEIKIKNKYFVHIQPRESDCRTELFYGDENLPLGWVSRNYDIRVPSYSAAVTNEIWGTTCLQTRIKINKGS